MTVRVLIADDQQLIRAGFRMILSTQPDIEVVGEAATGTEAVKLTRELHPDVVLMDIRMPDLDGIEATRQILAHNREPNPRVLILTTFDLDEYVYDALRAGASGFLLKDVPPDQLAAGVRMVGDGDALLAPSITRRLIEEFAASRTPADTIPGFSELSPRELDVFRLLASGNEQQRNRRRAHHRRDHGENPRHPNPHQARRPRPRPSGRPRLRNRTRHPETQGPQRSRRRTPPAMRPRPADATWAQPASSDTGEDLLSPGREHRATVHGSPAKRVTSVLFAVRYT